MGCLPGLKLLLPGPAVLVDDKIGIGTLESSSASPWRRRWRPGLASLSASSSSVLTTSLGLASADLGNMATAIALAAVEGPVVNGAMPLDVGS